MNPLQTRQAMGCGFELADPAVRPTSVWSPVSVFATWEGDEPTTCVGYTAKLPQVLEAARARTYWLKGQLELLVRGRASEQLLALMERLDSAYGYVEQLRHKEREAAS